MSKTKYTIEADASASPNVEELEVEVDGKVWHFDCCVDEPKPIFEGGIYGPPVWPEVQEWVITLTHARRFENEDDHDGTEVDVERALDSFFQVAGKALDAWNDYLEGLAEDYAERQYEQRYVGRY